MNIADLAKPFAPDRVSWRLGATNADKTKGMALAYIDARDVMERLDEICGLEWQADYIPMPNGTCCCRIGLKIGGEWVWRANGSLNISDSDKADAKEMAEKGSYSDAFKRAAVLWGIGRYLYDVDSPWVEIEQAGRSYKIAQREYARLRAILGGSAASQPPPRHEKPPKSNGSVAPSAPVSEKRISPEQWGLQSIERVKTLGERELADWTDKYGAALVKLSTVAPSIHAKLVETIRDREAEVGGPPF